MNAGGLAEAVAAELKEGMQVIAGTKSVTVGNASKTPGAGPRPPF